MSANVRQAILSLGGALLVTLGALHLAVTPFIARFIDLNTSPTGAAFLKPPMLLNHMVIGVLLLPLGGLTVYAAPRAVQGESWALVTTRVIAITVASLPIVLSILMGARYFGAKPFLLATVIVTVAAVVLLAAAFWPARRPAA